MTKEYAVQRLHPTTGEPYGFLDIKATREAAEHLVKNVYMQGTARVIVREVSDWEPYE